MPLSSSSGVEVDEDEDKEFRKHSYFVLLSQLSLTCLHLLRCRVRDKTEIEIVLKELRRRVGGKLKLTKERSFFVGNVT